MKNASLLSRILLIAVYLFGAATTSAYLILAVQSSQALVRSGQSGDYDLEIVEEDGYLIAAGVEERDFLGDVVPQVGDTLLTFDGAALQYDSAYAFINGFLTPGRETELTFVHQGDTLSATMLATKPSTKSLLSLWSLHVAKYLLVFAFVVVSLIALWRRSDSSPVRVLALFSFSIPVMIVAGVNIEVSLMPEYSPWIERFTDIVFRFNQALFAAFWMNLALLFPEPRKIMRERKWLGYLICYLPQALLVAVFAIVPGFREKYSYLILVVIVAQMTTGFILLGNAHRKAKDAMVKRQTRIVMYGTMAGVLPFALVIIVALAFGQHVLNVLPGGVLGVILVIFLRSG